MSASSRRCKPRHPPTVSAVWLKQLALDSGAVRLEPADLASARSEILPLFPKAKIFRTGSGHAHFSVAALVAERARTASATCCPICAVLTDPCPGAVRSRVR